MHLSTRAEERRLRNGLITAAAYVLFFALAARVAFDPGSLIGG
jgi:hypothetical protein